MNSYCGHLLFKYKRNFFWKKIIPAFRQMVTYVGNKEHDPIEASL
ncbi:hypothetical protein HMPREF0322_03804 [Desulfitobacterium hafniense DP7]|uniref:Uncharacterized protein n=1 Tax=Desulfitobacterium hafniense DP7 TaxID=537010 RepID=G9XS55_DESHA|nr:hypothetical protein HMPREF0322_03804 [Desulfitobacterium hafniense DP7]